MTTIKSNGWFDVDRVGLSKLFAGRGIEFAVFELIQNAWDEKNVTRVDVSLQPAQERGYSMLTVEDNAPDGFADLKHAYTLFAESAKKVNPQQRGRFNIGEKLVLSLCKWAIITTTKGCVTFTDKGRGQSKTSREFGTQFQALIKMNTEQRARVHHEITKLIAPKGITTTFNGLPLHDWGWRLEREIECTLPTMIADDQGVLVRSRRATTVRCYRVNDGETAMIYEMGLPVCETDCAFHVDVQQKVELTLDRENVSTRFLRAMRTAVFNETHELLDTEDCNHEWAQTAIESGNATTEAVSDYMTKRFGENRVSYDMSDPEANSRATAAGYTVVKGGQMSGAMWASVKTAGAIESAGALFPTHSGNFVAFEQADLTDGMKAVADYTQKLSQLLLGFKCRVEFGEQQSREAACWGSQRIQFNVRNLGKGWFNLRGNRLEIDDLIIHEFAHHFESNHLSDGYYNALSRLAAKAMQLGREGRLP